MLQIKKKTKNKYFLFDVSFYIYNLTYANQRTCGCVNSNGKVQEDCEHCNGKGRVLLTSSSGTVTGGLYGLFYMVSKMIDEGYNIELVFDPPKGQLDRSKLIENYKGNRGEKPDFIINQMALSKELFLLTNKIACYTSDTDESDDVLACRAIKLADEGNEVVVASLDKDFFPMLSHKNVKLYRDKMIFGIPEFHKYMKKKWDVSIPGPERFSEYLAIIGDIADNYNIIKGLGPKAAEYIINRYDPITELWKDWNNIPEKYKKRLVTQCLGDTCKKCKRCPNYDYDKKELHTLKLVDTLETSLKLAYLNMEAEYYKLENKNDYKTLYKKLEELELYNAIKNIHKLF